MSFRDMYFTELPFSGSCDRCDRVFKHEEALHTHSRCYPQHLVSKSRVKCNNCPYSASSFQVLRQHYASKHVPHKFICIMPMSSGVCGEKFATKQRVMFHIQKHCRTMSSEKTGKRETASSPVTDPQPDDSGSQTEEFASCGESDSDTDHSSHVKQERITASPSHSPCQRGASACHLMPVSSPSPPAAAEPHEDLLSISLKSLLKLMFRCADCGGYFVTDDDMRLHYSAHVLLTAAETANRRTS